MNKISFTFILLLFIPSIVFAVDNGAAINLDGSTQYLSGTTPSSGTYPPTSFLEQGVGWEARFRNLRLSHASDQTLLEMTNFGRLYIPASSTTLRFVARDGSFAEVNLGAQTNIIVRFGTSVGPYVVGPTTYVEVWNERFDVSSHLENRVTATNNNLYDLSSTAFAFGAKIDGTEKARVQIGFIRMSRGLWTQYLNYPSYWKSNGVYFVPYAAWFFENSLVSDTSLGAMSLTLTNNGSATYIATPNVAPKAYAGADQSGASIGRFLLSATESYDVDVSTIVDQYTPTSFSWTQLTGTTLTILHTTSASTFVDGCTAGNSYSFRVTVTDELGDTDTDDVSVTCVNPSASISVSNSTPYVGQVVRVFSTSVGYSNYLESDGYFGVNIDDGAGNGTASISNMPETAIAYLTAGSKTVTQNIKNHSGTTTSNTTSVTVSALPTSFATTLTASTEAGLQTAINTASTTAGNILIELTANTNINLVGSITLKKKIDSGLIWIRTTAYSSFPSLSRRINPATQQSLLTTLTMTGTEHPIFITESAQAVANYYIQGIDFYAGTNQQTGGIVVIGVGQAQTTTTVEPRNFVFAHCVFRGPVSTTVFTRHGLFINAREISVIGCYIDEIHDNTSESHGIAILNSSGGLFIWNNYIVAAGENILGGGSTINLEEMTPAHITIRRNYLKKHLKWQSTSWGGDVGVSDGSLWTIKNNLEFKTGKYIVIDANIYENCWVQGDQVGYAVNLNNIIDDPWAEFHWIQVTNGRMINTGTGHTLRARDEKIWKGKGSVMTHLLIRNNLYDPVGDILLWIPAGGYVANLLRGILDFGFVHNTHDETGPASLQPDAAAAAEKMYNAVIINNIGPHNTYGIKGSGVNPGNPTFAQFFVAPDYRGNILAGADSAQYPVGGSGNNANHYIAAGLLDDQYVDYINKNFVLAGSSVGKGTATDGTDIGVDISVLNAATFGVVTGIWDSSAKKCNWHANPRCNQ